MCWCDVRSSWPIIMWNWPDILKIWSDNVQLPTVISSTAKGYSTYNRCQECQVMDQSYFPPVQARYTSTLPLCTS